MPSPLAHLVCYLTDVASCMGKVENAQRIMPMALHKPLDPLCSVLNGTHFFGALDASAAYRALPLTGPGASGDGDDDTASPDNGPLLGYEDERLASTPERVALREALAELPERERRIVELRFYEGLTQSEIATKVGTSQVHVSRLLRSSLAKLQENLSA